MLELKKPSLCPHIIELYDFFEVEEYDVLVMEYMQPSMTLTAFFRRNNGPLTESVARLLILQILIALEHCLEHGINHSAIYEENILVNPKTLQVKLIGFGCSDYIAGHLKPHAGKMLFSSPLLLKPLVLLVTGSSRFYNSCWLLCWRICTDCFLFFNAAY